MSSVVSFVCFAILRHTISHYLLTFHCDTESDKVPTLWAGGQEKVSDICDGEIESNGIFCNGE